MPAPARIVELTDRFDYNLESYKKGQYNETQVRLEYINPLMEELGWDVTNKQGYSEAYKDVIHEDAVKVGGVTKAPDYCFRIGGTRKFFLEAKKPSVNIKEDTHPSYQLRRYAWSAKLPLSILTDFEEFAVYDCRVKPVKTDKASNARVIYLKYADYKDKWDEIAGIFSHEAILKGSFDKYVESKRKKKGTAEVDTAFLEEIERWRELLARNIAIRNPNLSQREVNFSVQRTIDRIIFLRICEDRGVENYGRLMALQNGERVYKRLFQLFREADGRYNSGLFYFQAEKGRPNDIDALTPDLTVDDKILKDILKNLYYPDSPYEFSVLPADILGQVYEQFLGKVIRLTPAHRAVIELKPEVRKAGGVYYTPTYIVDYIVKETVGKLVEGKKPGPRGGVTKLKILDPACGSGSFLLGAYQYLLDWHRDEYVKDDPVKWAKGKNPTLYRASAEDWRLTTAERKRILLNNIYGVDIDHQAVEVTKLSLLLKVLEGEDEETIQRQLSLFQQRALPDLGNNIKCGNSLIGSDFYDRQQINLFDDEEMYRINAFDWEDEFPDIIKSGGFDAVIGNPPYGAIINKDLDSYYHNCFISLSGTCDTFALFIEKSAKLLKLNGYFGMIVPSTWVSAPAYTELRKFISYIFSPKSFVSMPYDVFGAYIDTLIVTATKAPENKALVNSESAPVGLIVFPFRKKISSVTEFNEFRKTADAARWLSLPDSEFIVTLSDIEYEILQKISAQPSVFGDFCDIQRGVTPFHTTEEPPEKSPAKAFKGTVRRYILTEGKESYIRYDKTLAEFKPERYFKGPRLLLRELISRQFQLQAVYVDVDFITNKSMQSILIKDGNYSPHYVLGLLNSRLISWYFLSVHSVGRRDDFPKIVLKQSRQLPFRSIDWFKKRDVASHENMVNLVKRMLNLKKEIAESRDPQTKTVLQRQIEATNRQIDKLAYKLYDLTDEEIEIVEGLGSDLDM